MNTSNERNQYLQFSLLKGDFLEVQEAIRGGADVNNDTSYFNNSPLHLAVRNNLEIAKFLVSEGADIEFRNAHGGTPLHTAIGEGYIDAVKWLISIGADYEAKDYEGCTPFHKAASSGRLEIVKYLAIEVGVDVCARTNKGKLAEDLAGERRYYDIKTFIQEYSVEDIKEPE